MILVPSSALRATVGERALARRSLGEGGYGNPMNKHLVRCIALLLVPALIADPVFAVPLKTSHHPQNDLFAEQAFVNRAINVRRFLIGNELPKIRTIVSGTALLLALAHVSARPAFTQQRIAESQTSLETLLGALARPFDDRSLAMTIYQIGQTYDASALPAIEPYLKHQDNLVRSITLHAVFKLGRIEPVLQALRTDDIAASLAFTSMWSEASTASEPPRAHIVQGLQAVARDNKIKPPTRSRAVEAINRSLRNASVQEAVTMLGLQGLEREIFEKYGWKVYGADDELLRQVATSLEPIRRLAQKARLKAIAFVDPEYLASRHAEAENVQGLILLKRVGSISVEVGVGQPASYVLPHEIAHDIMPGQLPQDSVDQYFKSWISALAEFIDLDVTHWYEKEIVFEQAYCNAVNDWVHSPEKFFFLSNIEKNKYISDFVLAAAKEYIFEEQGKRFITFYWPEGLGAWPGSRSYTDVELPPGDLNFSTLARLYLNTMRRPAYLGVSPEESESVLRVYRLMDFLYGPEDGRMLLPYLRLSNALPRHSVRPELRDWLLLSNAYVRRLFVNASQGSDRILYDRLYTWGHFVNTLTVEKLKPELLEEWRALQARLTPDRTEREQANADLRQAFRDVLGIGPSEAPLPAAEAKREFVRQLLRKAGLEDLIVLQAPKVAGVTIQRGFSAGVRALPSKRKRRTPDLLTFRLYSRLSHYQKANGTLKGLIASYWKLGEWKLWIGKGPHNEPRAHRDALVAFLNDRPIGLHAFTARPGTSLSFDDGIFVDPKEWDQRVGSRLRVALLQYLREEGHKKFIIQKIDKTKEAQKFDAHWLRYPGVTKRIWGGTEFNIERFLSWLERTKTPIFIFAALGFAALLMKGAGLFMPHEALAPGAMAHAAVCWFMLGIPLHEIPLEEAPEKGSGGTPRKRAAAVENPLPKMEYKYQSTSLSIVSRGKYAVRNLLRGGPIPQPPWFVAFDEPGLHAGQQTSFDITDNSYHPALAQLQDERNFETVARWIVHLKHSGRFPVHGLIYKPNVGGYGMGIMYLRLDSSGRLAITMAYNPHFPGAYARASAMTSLISRRGLGTAKHTPQKDIVTMILNVDDEQLAAALRDIWNEASIFNIEGKVIFDAGMLEPVMPSLQPGGRAYETRHVLKGDLFSSNSDLLKTPYQDDLYENGSYARRGSSPFFGNITYRSGHTLELDYRSMYDPLYGTMPELMERKQEFEQYVDRLIRAEFVYLSARMRAWGLHIPTIAYVAFDLQWMPPEKAGQFPVPFLTEAYIGISNKASSFKRREWLKISPVDIRELSTLRTQIPKQILEILPKKPPSRIKEPFPHFSGGTHRQKLKQAA